MTLWALFIACFVFQVVPLSVQRDSPYLALVSLAPSVALFYSIVLFVRVEKLDSFASGAQVVSFGSADFRLQGKSIIRIRRPGGSLFNSLRNFELIVNEECSHFLGPSEEMIFVVPPGDVRVVSKISRRRIDALSFSVSRGEERFFRLDSSGNISES
ncbi:hypothetical protein [Nocardiopsis dassonvillei]|uniref:hypothetical protein n=1 Tax=Nocardiopsis dassonvillei TaxID=2014 RepID=UPI000F83F17C|nr:hypothetical protein [Nocardiopsis dassonvillei]